MPHRYLPSQDEQRDEMLRVIGVSDAGELFSAVPDSLRLPGGLDIPPAASELEVRGEIARLASKNVSVNDLTCFLGAGTYDRYIPASVRAIVSLPEFYTAYTPYQAEISQGTLTVMFEFQSMTAALTGMHSSNASMYDGASCSAEAALLAVRHTGRRRVLVSGALNPEYDAVISSYARFNSVEIVRLPAEDGLTPAGECARLAEGCAAVIVQTPNFFGIAEDLRGCAAAAHSAGALLVAVNANPHALTILDTPGDAGADLVCGEGQGLGIDPYYGGAHLGYMACTESLIRKIPGRVSGQTRDSAGRRVFVLTLQAREQHIRRASATSNICTAQALNALKATVYMSLMGEEGLRQVCLQGASKAAWLRSRLEADGIRVPFAGPFIDEFPVILPVSAREASLELRKAGILGGYDVSRSHPGLEGAENMMLIAVTEKRTLPEMEKFAQVLGGLKR